MTPCSGRYRQVHARGGAAAREGARRVLKKLIVRANGRRDKAPVLLEVREEIEALKVVLRLCQDTKAFP